MVDDLELSKAVIIVNNVVYNYNIELEVLEKTNENVTKYLTESSIISFLSDVHVLTFGGYNGSRFKGYTILLSNEYDYLINDRFNGKEKDLLEYVLNLVKKDLDKEIELNKSINS